MNLEADGNCDNLGKIIIMPEGVNGLQPNLDYVNVISKVLSYRSIPTTLNEYVEPHDFSYKARFTNVVNMMINLAFGYSTAQHGLFLK